MAISPFVFSSENLPRHKAKQLYKAFPHLKLSVAQEATARALGYSSWYECIHRGSSGEASLSDQQAGLPVRVGRYYHQAGVVMGLGIAPLEADLWVRAWGLTGKPTLAPESGIPMYFRWNDTLERLERGELSEEDVKAMWWAHDSKYPGVDMPVRVCPGVILGPLGRYPHYAVHPEINARIPIYLRGPSSLYHIEDDYDVLAMSVAGFEEDGHPADSFIQRLDKFQYEWHLGKKHPSSSVSLLSALESAAMSSPEAMVVISQRSQPDLNGKSDHNICALACLRGRDFAAFLRAKGVIDVSKVVWYRDVDARQADFQGGDWNFSNACSLPVFLHAHKHQPSLPLYSYPFKKAPMHSDEYTTMFERVCLLPLDQDYSGDGGDDDDDRADDTDPVGPAPLLEEMLEH